MTERGDDARMFLASELHDLEDALENRVEVWWTIVARDGGVIGRIYSCSFYEKRHVNEREVAEPWSTPPVD